MKTFWVTGRKFADDHDRAVRFIDQDLMADRMREPTFPKDGRVGTEFCDRCNAWHIVRLEAISGIALVGTDPKKHKKMWGGTG